MLNSLQDICNRAQHIQDKKLEELGSVLIFAPHQDDESLGCGGTIALLKKEKMPVHVAFTTDGSGSHPNSLKYPTEKLIHTRKKEAVDALKILGVKEVEITFLNMKDGRLPFPGDPDFMNAVRSVQKLIEQQKPTTIFLPWRRDPHSDHRATWQIVNRAIQNNDQIRKIEYLIWLWERGLDQDLPSLKEHKIWYVDISSVLNLKKQAIEAHRSQITLLIDDDPEGFILSPEVLAHFNKSKEVFVEDLS